MESFALPADNSYVSPEEQRATVVADDPSDVDRARLHDELRRLFATSAWVGPVGTTALTVLVAGVVWSEIDRTSLVVWIAVVAVAVIGQVLSIAVPSIRRRRADSGLPKLTHWSHLLIGLAFGSVLMLDRQMVERADLRWFGLMAMFALSAGVSTGLAGLNSLALRVLVPTWLMGSAVLFVNGQWLMGGSAAAFLIICVVDQHRSGEVWRELVTLRLDQERRTEQQRWIAQHDDLTGLLNRAGIVSAVDAAAGRSATAMYVDLDQFKEVNDRLGHAAGDEVLVEVARRLRAAVRDDDAVGRLGGDEFLVVFGRELHRDRSASLGAELIESIERPIETSAGIAEVSASVGVATLPARHNDGEALMVRADHALLLAKRRGRRRVEHHEAPGPVRREAHRSVRAAN